MPHEANDAANINLEPVYMKLAKQIIDCFVLLFQTKMKRSLNAFSFSKRCSARVQRLSAAASDTSTSEEASSSAKSFKDIPQAPTLSMLWSMGFDKKGRNRIDKE